MQPIFLLVFLIFSSHIDASPLASDEQLIEEDKEEIHVRLAQEIEQDEASNDVEVDTSRRQMEEKGGFWYDNAIERLEIQLNSRENYNTAKNVILFLGDGMSMTTITAARIYKGQKTTGGSGEENALEFEKLPYTGLSKTYCVDKQVADSACSATALLCGIKSQMGTVGVTGAVPRGNCSAVNAATIVPSLMHWAQLAGKSTGIITTTRVTHASPAASYAHSADRTWEAETKKHCKVKDIALQLVTSEPGSKFNVVLGGGKRNFYSKNALDEDGLRGKRKDGKDLIETWIQGKPSTKSKYITNRNQLLNLDVNNTDYLLGLFSHSHFDYHLDADHSKQPTLEEMTQAAISVLSKNPKGYFLFVEGGRIDHGHHETKAIKALDETVELSKAVGKALEIVNTQDTLAIVTADHAHTLTMSGYPARGTPIAGKAGTALNSKPYSTLSYANGPSTKGRSETDENDHRFPSMVTLKKETHGGEDVPVYSIGPWSHLLKGTFEQNYITLAIMYAACVGPLPTSCLPPRLPRTTKQSQ